MSEQTIVKSEKCIKIREQYSQREGIEPLAEKHGVEFKTLRYHLYGDCSHDIAVEPLTPPVEHQLNESNCRSLREKFADGTDIDELQEDFETRRRPVIRHLTGDCSHENDAPTVVRDDVLQRQSISASACAVLRERYLQSDESTILDIARDVRWSYPAVQKHINGQCQHDIETSSRAIQQRVSDVSADKCAEIRQRWRRNPELSLKKLASENDQSKITIERHIKFVCSHPQEELLIDEMAIFDQWLRNEENDTFEIQDVLDASDDFNLDPEEVAADVITPQEVETTISRKVRNTAIVVDLKQAYEYQCQVCGDMRYRGLDEPYAEGHHVRPLGKLHEGPDVPGNILVLCPNHHTDFDYGVIDIHPETHRIRHVHDDDVDGTELTVDPEHELDPMYLDYHQQQISVIDRSDGESQ